MPVTLRLRLFLSFLLVLALGMLLVATLTWFSVEGMYLDSQRENLLAQARLLAAAFQGNPLPVEPVEPYMQSSNVMPGIHTRLLNEQGGVIIGPQFAPEDDFVQVPMAENAGFVSSQELLQRPEIEQALQGQPMTAIRRVDTAGGGRMLYAAAPMQDTAGKLTGIVYLATPLPRSRLPIGMILQFAGSGLIAVILASLAATWLSRRIAQPVEDLSLATKAISRGEVPQQVPTEYTIRELQELSQSFNRMSASLQQSIQVRNTFIADVTHELRTPLTVIKGTTETLEDGAIDDLAARGSLLSAMQRETDRLIRLVNDLLVLTRADASALMLKITTLDLTALAKSRCQYLTPLAAERHIILQVLADLADASQGLFVMGDSDRLAQVLDNLLDNAIRYAPKGSQVSVTLKPAGREIQCAVHNPGPGISEQHLPYLFERFYRVDSSRDRKTGGTGLGLAIVRALVTAQGGHVIVQSSPGEGTTFILWLPKAETDTELPENGHAPDPR